MTLHRVDRVLLIVPIWNRNLLYASSDTDDVTFNRTNLE